MPTTRVYSDGECVIVRQSDSVIVLDSDMVVAVTRSMRAAARECDQTREKMRQLRALQLWAEERGYVV